MDKLLGSLVSLHQFLTLLSWTKIFQLVVLFVVLGLGWVVYQGRNDLWGYINHSKIENHSPQIKKLSKQTTDEIDNSINNQDLIIAASVTVVDFQKNIKYVVYTKINDDRLRDLYTKYNQAIDTPIFANNNPELNARIINLINGEFICNPYIEHIGYVQIPGSEKYITTTCSNGIPPYYGKFTGVVSVFLRRTPTPEEVDQLRAMIKVLSADIYNKDLR